MQEENVWKESAVNPVRTGLRLNTMSFKLPRIIPVNLEFDL